MSLTLEEIPIGTGHEQVVFCRDPEAGYRGIIAIHSTAAGTAAGGTRYWTYAREEDALTDALRLSRGMTYKSLMAGLPLGGGKSVILRDAASEAAGREAVFRAHGRAVERLGGLYLTAEDVGTSQADMEIIRQETRHVAGVLDDPSPNTARGVLRAMAAAACHRWGTDDLAGRTVAIQGCGNVGFHLARGLAAAGARLIVADVDPGRVRRTVEATGARAVDPEEILRVEADVLAACALGGILNAVTIPGLRVEVVAGAANNQLWEEDDGRRLSERSILYAPDYVANAGGVIGGCREILGWSEEETRRRIDGIYDTLLEVLRLAQAEGLPPHAAADRLAEQRLATLEAARRTAMSLEIQNDEKNRRFHASVDGHEATIEYVKMGDAYNLLHTFVPEELRGRHVGEGLVRGTLEQIKAQGATFLPTCPFVQTFLKRHPEYQEGVAHAG